MKYIIIGGVAGGASTAARLRRNDENADIVMFERGAYISYANCGLPYHVGGTIPERDRLFVQTPEQFMRRFNVNVRVRCDVLEIDRKAKQVMVKDLESGSTFKEYYDKLVLSPGAEPVRPPIPGIDMEGIFTLRNVPDTDIIKTYINTKNPKRAVIVGAGFIGLEMAENLHRQGIFVTIVEMAEQVMIALDYEMAAEVHQHLTSKNVEFYLQNGVVSFERKNDKILTTLKSGTKLPADMVVLSIGVRPENRLAKQAGLDIGKTGGIVVDAFMRTSDPDIYALGDAVELPDPITGTKGIIPLAGPANKQARVVADNIVHGNGQTYKGTIGTAIAKVFDITVAATGLSEKTLTRLGLPFESIVTHSSSHAGYYPGAMPVSIKTMFDPKTGRLLGGQIVGYEGVDKRIDVMASVIKASGTVRDLMDMEHAYAPPYSSAKDPVNIAGFVADNILRGKSRHIHWHHVKDNPGKYALVDVRTQEEFALGNIEGSVNIPVDELRSRIEEVPRSKPLVVYCGVGQRAYLAERILRQKGFEDVFNLSGGYKTYSMACRTQGNEDIFEKDFIGKDDMIYQANPDAETFDIRSDEIIEADACGLQCPGPIGKLNKEIGTLRVGQYIRLKATDPGFARDVKSWCNMTGNELKSLTEEGGTITALIQKREALRQGTAAGPAGNAVTLIVFSDDMDKALASFVIANGAASSGKKVTMFFTFWGLNVIKKERPPKVAKDFMGRMFGAMLPKNSKKLKLSKLNMAGMGRNMMRGRMAGLGIDSLETMIQTAVENGVTMIGCQMSMDVMGVKKEELLSNVEIGGVAAYLEAAGKAQTSLFI